MQKIVSYQTPSYLLFSFGAPTKGEPMSKTYDKTIRSLLKELPVAFLELLIGEKLSKDAPKPLDVKL